MVPFTHLVAVKKEDCFAQYDRNEDQEEQDVKKEDCFAQYVRNEDQEEQDADDELFIQDEKDVAGYVRARKKPRRN